MQDDVGRAKVHATADICQQMNHELQTDEIESRFRRNMQIGNVMFCAVDHIETRKLIWAAVKDRVQFHSDGRMSAEVLRSGICDEASRRHYPRRCRRREAYSGACTARAPSFVPTSPRMMLEQFADGSGACR